MCLMIGARPGLASAVGKSLQIVRNTTKALFIVVEITFRYLQKQFVRKNKRERKHVLKSELAQFLVPITMDILLAINLQVSIYLRL